MMTRLQQSCEWLNDAKKKKTGRGPNRPLFDFSFIFLKLLLQKREFVWGLLKMSQKLFSQCEARKEVNTTMSKPQ